MNELNSLILKRQIYKEIYNNSFTEEKPLFNQYITKLIEFYEHATSIIFEEDIKHLRTLVSKGSDVLIFVIFNYIEKVNNVDILLDILSYFIGRTESKKYIYSS